MTEVPFELSEVVRIFQRRNRIASYNQAIRRLLETHPDLVQIATQMYNGLEAAPGGNRESG